MRLLASFLPLLPFMLRGLIRFGGWLLLACVRVAARRWLLRRQERQRRASPDARTIRPAVAGAGTAERALETADGTSDAARRGGTATCAGGTGASTPGHGQQRARLAGRDGGRRGEDRGGASYRDHGARPGSRLDTAGDERNAGRTTQRQATRNVGRTA